jgi:hypothetical protein
LKGTICVDIVSLGVEVHVEGALEAESFVRVGAVVDGVVAVGAGGVGLGFGESGFKSLVLCVVLGVETGLTAPVIAQTEVLDQRQLAGKAALFPHAPLQHLDLETGPHQAHHCQ